MFKVNSRKTRLDLLARCAVEWRGVPVKEVVSGGFWVVSDGFCWLQVISDGFKWFSVLVATRMLQHTQEFFLFCNHKRTWLTEVIQFFCLKYDSKKKIIVVLPPSRLKISDYFLYSIVLFPTLLLPILYPMSCKKLHLKEVLKRNIHKTQRKCSFSVNHLKFLWKQEDYSLSRGDWENWDKIGRSPHRMEGDGKSIK